ncbi:MAG TPA: molybdenum cofactor guanylyltransferase [Tepidisphaeraceae bacterium]|nr:molybdenum cofactor guanylyltransferase [Tepidisphaeraceae bacterium]
MSNRMDHTSFDICRRTTLALLAGGEARRMGQAKALLHLHGTPILSYLHSRLSWPGPTLLVTAPGREHPPGTELFSAEVTDPIAGQGPLRGVLTALEAATTSHVVVMPVDMPNVTADALAWLVSRLIERPEAPLAMVERTQDGAPQIEPMPAAFNVVRALPLIRQQLESNHPALRDLAALAGAAIFPAPDFLPPDFWVNLNYPEDVKSFSRPTP